ncbi:MAG: type III pantothenate kinase [Oscillospiraceae bacterium]
MILAIDVGNTNIVLGCVNNKEVTSMARVATNKLMTSDEYCIKIKAIMDLRKIELDKIDGCIISSVVPPVTSVLKKAINLLLGEPAMVVGPGIKTDFDIKIDNPAQLGSDLVVAATAVIDEYPLPAVVVDMGTATTFSVVSKKKSYLGGLIVPGLMTSLQALTSNTAQLPNISLEAPPHVIGKNTIDCMKSGIIFSNAAAIDGIVDRIEEQLGEKVTVVATGGLASVIKPHCKHRVIYDETLLLKGLFIIYNKNKG